MALLGSSVPAFASTATGWPVFRKVQSVRPQALSATHYFPGDISGMLHNPAVVGMLAGSELDVSAGSGGVDERVAGVLYGRKSDKNGINFALGAYTYDYGTMALNWIEGNEIKERTVSAQRDYLALASAGGSFGKWWWGVTGKAASSTIAEEATAYAAAADAGVCYPFTLWGGKVNVSLAGQNVGAATKFIEKSEALPAALSAGMSCMFNTLGGYILAGCEAPWMLANSEVKPSLAVEAGKFPVSVFAGYRAQVDDAAYTYGVSIALSKCDFSYSYTPARWLDGMHRVAVSMKMGTQEDERAGIREAYRAKAAEREQTRIARIITRTIKGRKKETAYRLKSGDPARAMMVQLRCSSTTIGATMFVERVVDQRVRRVARLGSVWVPQAESGAEILLSQPLHTALLRAYEQVFSSGTERTALIVVVHSLSIKEGLKPYAADELAGMNAQRRKEIKNAPYHDVIRAELDAEIFARAGEKVKRVRECTLTSPWREITGVRVLGVLNSVEDALSSIISEAVSSQSAEGEASEEMVFENNDMFEGYLIKGRR